MKEKICKKNYKHMQAKRNATKQPVDHWRNQRGKCKIPGKKWKWKHNNPKSVGCFKREVCGNTSLPQEKENS